MARNNGRYWNRRLLVGLAACCLVACGADQLAGIQGSGAPVAAGITSTGPINGFGSVILGGIEYDTAGAQIQVDDQPATESQLRVGHVITLKGSVNADGTTGKATEISFVSNLRGPISKIDIANATFTILGQTVRVDDATLFDDSFQSADLTAARCGLIVQVSGFANAAGELVASRIEPSQAAAGLQVKGTVQALDTVAQTFRINALTVDYSGVAPSGTLANGSNVVVRGSTLAPSGALVATRVQVINAPANAANDRGQVSGVVTTFASAVEFVVDGQRVLTNSATEVVLHGATLGVNARVEVQGTFDATGALVANKVEVRPQTLSLVRGLVDAASSTSLTVLGVSVTVTNTTSFEDRSSQPVRQFSLADVRTGDYVEIRGTPNSAGTGLVATLVERDRPETRSYLQGLVLSVNNPSFTVLSVNVATNAQTRFIGLGASSDAAAQFFSQAPNKMVRVRGTATGSVLLAEQVQIRP